MVRISLSVLVLLLIGYGAICVYFYVQQRSLLYYPVPANGALDTVGIAGADDGVRASVSNLESPHALVYFGGNAEDVSVTAEALADRFPFLAVYALHYRGYGESSGSPSEAAIVEDATALIDLAMSTHESVRVVGRSLGSGVAIQASVDRQIQTLTLVTPFGSIRKIASSAFPYLPVSLLIKDPYDSTEYARRVSSTVRVIVAGNDEVIPRWSTDDLIQSFGGSSAVAVDVLEGRGHNDIQLASRYWELLLGL